MTRFGLWVMAMALVFLCGCSPMLYDQYIVVTPHEVAETEDSQDYLVAQNYLSLKNALLDMVSHGETEGKIRFYDYVGDLENDFQMAAEEVLYNDPLGTYALEDLEYNLAFVVSYYEGEIAMTYRHTQEQIDAIGRLDSITLAERTQQALGNLETEVVVRDTFYTGFDVEKIVDEYYSANPEICIEKPNVTLTTYPESGYVRTVELLFSYENDVEDLIDYRSSIETSVRAAEEYVRYRDGQTEKMRLLYSFFDQRFVYDVEITNTPVYSFLCEGISSSYGASKSLEIICQAMDMTCYTVTGTKLGVAYSWNIMEVDGQYYHVDLQDALVRGLDTLPLLIDADMVDYQWDTANYPVSAEKPMETVAPMPAGMPPEIPTEGDAEDPPMEPEEQEEIFEEIEENDLTNDESVVQ